MRIVFFGTPAFAVPSLATLAKEHDLVAVVTRQDKPRGRRLRLQASIVKQWASLNISSPILEPEDIKQTAFLSQLADLDPDLFVVAAYGRIMPKELLAVPLLGSVNVHASLLPRWRGAAPVQRALMAGDDKTGVTIMLMDEGLDTGPILAQAEIAVEAEDNAETLLFKLADLGADLLAPTITRFSAGEISPRPQPTAGATYAPPLKKEELLIDWRQPASRICDLIRALAPEPGAYTLWQDRRLKILKASHNPEAVGAPGALTLIDDCLQIGTGAGSLTPLEMQPEGKRRMTAVEFVHGYRPAADSNLG